MVDTTIINKFKLIFELLKDNLLFSFVLLLLIFIIMDLCYGKNSKKTKILYGIIISLILTYFFIVYNKPLLNIIDIYITAIFKIAYFPSIIEYFTMILITIIIQIISIKKSNKILKNINIWIGIIIEILFSINIIAIKNISINLNNTISIYENDLLLSIFQVSGIIFIIWIILNIIIYIINIFLDKEIELPKLKNV